MAHNSSLGADLLTLISRLHRLANRHISLPIPAAQARLLLTIQELGQSRISQLAQADNCSQPTMTTQIRRLEQAGLIQRVTDSSDGRAVLIEITPKGTATLAQIHQDRMAAITEKLSNLNEEDAYILTRATEILHRFLDSRKPLTSEE